MGTSLRAGILSDLHFVSDTSRRGIWQNPYDFAGVAERCERALELFDREEVDVVLLVGDLSEDAELPMLRRALRLRSRRAPTFAVAGNHDGMGRIPRARRGERGTARMLGVRGREMDGVRLAGLPIARRAEGEWRSVRRPGAGDWGREPVLFVSHFPVLARAEAVRKAGLRHPGDLIDRRTVERALERRRRPTVVLSGHVHVRDSASSGPILQLICGGLIEPPFDATVLTIEADGDAVTLTRTAHELGRGRERRDPRMVAARERWRFTPRQGWRRRSGRR
jgi:predicted phosphodiesterase